MSVKTSQRKPPKPHTLHPGDNPLNLDPSQKEEVEAVALLLRRNRELEVLNTISQAISNSRSLNQTLEIALSNVLSIMESDTGWICLLATDGTCSAFVGQQGLCWQKDAEGYNICLRDCVCKHVQQTQEVVFIDHLHPTCPLLMVKSPDGSAITAHASIPLTFKSRVVGQLNIASHDGNCLNRVGLSLLSAIGPQLGVAIENARLWEDIQQKELMQEALIKKVVSAQEDERQRLARELHDEIGQMLTSLLIGLKVLDGSEAPPEIHALNADMKNTVSQILDSIRDLALELRPYILDDRGLVPALSNYARRCQTRFGIEVDFVTSGMDGIRLPRETELSIYRIVQESLVNVVRHAQTERASVLLERRDHSIVAIVEDTGQGFDLNEIMSYPDERHRLGLFGLKERAALVGGRLTIESTPGSGTTIFVEVPIPESPSS